MTGHHVADLTSGFRAVRADKFREFLHLLPNGFSYPDHQHDGVLPQRLPGGLRADPGRASASAPPATSGRCATALRFLLIIFKIATLYSPLKLFAPAALVFFLLGVGYYAYTFVDGASLHQHEHVAVQRRR